MSMQGLLAEQRIIPVVVIDDPGAGADLVQAIAAGGISIVEITLRTPMALETIRRSADSASVVVGAGTVLSTEDLDRAVDAGARFIVSPGLDERLVVRARDLGVGVLPGVASATEVQHATRIGVDLVKFFPADRLGGLGTISALSAPFGQMRFVPSGGVNTQNAREYLAHEAVPAVSGSWMVPQLLIRDRAFEEIARLCRDAVADLP